MVGSGRGIDAKVGAALLGLLACVLALSLSTSAYAAPPTVTITAGPAGSTGDSTPTFDFHATDAATVSCSIDHGTPSYSLCPAPSSYTPASPLADGIWTFHVLADSGTGQQAEDSRTFTVDTTPPVVAVDSGPAGPTGDTTPTFSYSAPEAASYLCRVYAQGSTPPSFDTCSGPGQTHTPTSALADGSYTFEVRATDGAGNQATASRSFTVDSAAPAVSIDSGPSGPTSNAKPSFGFSANGAITFACRIFEQNVAAPAFGPCAGPGQSHSPTSPLPDGVYTFEVRATDQAGNQAMSARTFTVDTTAPAVSVDSGPSGQTLDTTPVFSFSAGERASFACRFGAGDFGPCTGPGQTYRPPALTDGKYTFEVRATDGAGNQATASRSFTLTAAACRTALNAVVAANGGLVMAEQKLTDAKASGKRMKIKRAKKSVKKAKKLLAATKHEVNTSCVTSGD